MKWWISRNVILNQNLAGNLKKYRKSLFTKRYIGSTDWSRTPFATANKSKKPGRQFLKVVHGLKYWRHRPESNRCTRICNPLHSHSATAPQLKLFSAIMYAKSIVVLRKFYVRIKKRLVHAQKSSNYCVEIFLTSIDFKEEHILCTIFLRPAHI